MTINLRLFGALKEYQPEGVPRRGGPYGLPEGTTAQRLILDLGIPYGGEEGEIVVSVNDVQVEHGHVFQEGESVSLFEPLAGG